MPEFFTAAGDKLELAPFYHDRRTSNRRYLNVLGLQKDGRIACRVVSQEYNEQITKPNRDTAIQPARLTSTTYVPLPTLPPQHAEAPSPSGD